MIIYWTIGVIVLLILLILWVGQYGIIRGPLAILCRVAWIFPIILCFFPDVRVEDLPRTLALKPIHILVDDSLSMQSSEFSTVVEKDIEAIRAECLRLGCMVKVTQLSELAKRTHFGYTPLRKALEAWSHTIGDEPWIIFSDGGDSYPSLSLGENLGSLVYRGKERGLIIGFEAENEENIWLEPENAPIFAFTGSPVEVSLTVKRYSKSLVTENVQVQAVLGEKVLSTVNAEFGKGEEGVDIRMSIPPLAKGRHLLSIKALPTVSERALWDNTTHRVVIEMANTIGVLHLLGSPSWDGRYLRRYLKAEPKYDLISFFILRDPGDLQMVNERELSLIPFPVDRLFNEELPNFHIVVLQNFALFQFLEPSYQRNLVAFVKNGGGLLFLGGPRALQVGDYRSSALSSILPFSVKGSGVGPSSPARVFNRGRVGPYFDEKIPYTFELASPKKGQVDLANIFTQWKGLLPKIQRVGPFYGLHNTQNVEFKDDGFTPLLEAKVAPNKSIPLAVASYPGKGRALWFFGDSLYQLALSGEKAGSRDVYQQFMEESFTWLLRQEIKKPLIARDLLVTPAKLFTSFQFELVGPAGRFLESSSKWELSVCGVSLDWKSLSIDRKGHENYTIRGAIPIEVVGGSRCNLEIYGEHDAFGSVKAGMTAIVPEELLDAEVGGARQHLIEISRVTGAQLVWANSKDQEIQAHLDQATERFGVSFPSRFVAVQDHYWVFDKWWVWLLLLFLPLEIISRRWPQLTTMSLKLF